MLPKHMEHLKNAKKYEFYAKYCIFLVKKIVFGCIISGSAFSEEHSTVKDNSL